MLAYQHDYYAAHMSETSATKKVYRKKHRERLAQYFRDYYRHNKTKLLEYGRKYREVQRVQPY
jgi:hypothetical protein